MAHFVNVSNNVVGNAIVVDNADCGNLEFPESESVGQDFISNTLNLEGGRLQTSYSGSFRGCYAGIGYTYDPIGDVFVDIPYTPPEY